MALTRHQEKHVLAMRADARDMPTDAGRNRVIDEADKLLDGRSSWPADLREESGINDWIETPAERRTRDVTRDG